MLHDTCVWRGRKEEEEGGEFACKRGSGTKAARTRSTDTSIGVVSVKWMDLRRLLVLAMMWPLLVDEQELMDPRLLLALVLPV